MSSNMEENYTINILDGKGFVRYLNHMGDDVTTVNAARTSFAKVSSYNEDGSIKPEDAKLIKFLALNDPPHFSPFTHPQISLHLKVPIYLRNQLDRSRIGLTISEVSRRYISTDPEYYFPRLRSAPVNGAKQGSHDFIPEGIDLDLIKKDGESCINFADATYKRMIEMGVCPEQARGFLPLCMYTEYHWTGSLFAFARVYNLRIDAHAQWDCQQVAVAIGEICEKLFPLCWKYLCSATKEEKLIFTLQRMAKEGQISELMIEEMRKIVQNYEQN